jgi:hypothetical protein
VYKRRLWKLGPLSVGARLEEPGGVLLYREDQEIDNVTICTGLVMGTGGRGETSLPVTPRDL